MENARCFKTVNAIAPTCLLVIDDEPDVREIVQVSLEYSRSWQVLTAKSGQEGLAIAQTQQPDAILLDMDLNDMDGYGILSELRHHPKTVHIPVIFLTANRSVKANEEMQTPELEVHGAIQKPFDPGLLANQIEVLLNWQVPSPPITSS